MTMALTELAIVDLLDGLRILLVEDEYLIAMDVETICLEHGAADVAIVSRLSDLDDDGLMQHIDIAILDLMLDGSSTLDFAARLQSRGIPFIFASGHSMTDEIRVRFPLIRLVEKPYSGDDLVNALADAGRTGPPQSTGDVIT